MKKLYAIILIFAFAACYIPALQALCKVDNAIAWVDFDEEKDNDPQKGGKKALKDMLGHFNEALQQVTVTCDFCRNSHQLGDNPSLNILTPPPNHA